MKKITLQSYIKNNLDFLDFYLAVFPSCFSSTITLLNSCIACSGIQKLSIQINGIVYYLTVI